MYAFYLFSIWLHILAAAVWIGGMVFIALIVVPVIRQQEFRGSASSLIHATGVRFRWVGWTCLILLLLTGAVNLVYRGMEWAHLWSGQFWQLPFGTILGTKALLVLVILFLSVLHDFNIGPRATALWQTNPASPEAVRLRRQASWIGRVNLLLALLVVALGIMLARGFSW